MTENETKRGLLWIVAAAVLALPAPTAGAATVKAVQSGTAVSTANGILTVPITAVDPTKSFLIFQTRHDSNRPVGSGLRGRLATATTLEFERVTDEGSPVPITIQWYLAEFSSGVSVQRGETTQSPIPRNIAITPVAAVNQAFVTWSKTGETFEANFDEDNFILGELTSTSNLQIRGQSDGNKLISWQVIEFTNPADINVQKGSTSLTGATLSVDVTLPTPVDVDTTFVLVGYQAPILVANIASAMVRAQLIDSTTIRIDRDGNASDIDEIVWQAVELKDGSTVQRGTTNFVGGDAQQTAALTAVDTSRSIAFGSAQPSNGQGMGKTPYAADDIIGVCSVTTALTSTQLTLDRDSTVDTCDVGWFVVEFSPPVFYSVGTDTSDLKTGSPTITISGGLATLDVAQTNDIGVGDVIDYGGTLVYIFKVVSPTQFRVQNADGSGATDVGAAVSVTTIKRAFNSISQAEAQSSDASHLGTANLLTAGRRLTWVCYNDGPLIEASVITIDGYTTDAAHFITLTVAGASQVATGNSQRHNGTAFTGTNLTTTTGGMMSVNDPYTTIEWLIFKEWGSGSTQKWAIDVDVNNGVHVRNNIFYGGASPHDTASAIQVDRDNHFVYNNIVYNLTGTAGGRGIWNDPLGDNVSYINNTVYNCRVGFQFDNSGTDGLAINNISVGNTTDYTGVFHASSTNNLDSDGTAPGGSSLTAMAASLFVSAASPENLHLRPGAAAIDAGSDQSGVFADDIDGHVRPQGAAWDMGADESFFSGVPTNYRSIGTNPANLHPSGTASVTLGSTTVTFSAALPVPTATGAIGLGDKLTIEGEVLFIRFRNSDFLVTLQSPATVDHSTPTATFTVTRAYNTLQAWEDDCVAVPGCLSTSSGGRGGDLVTDDRFEIGVAYNDVANGPFIDNDTNGSVVYIQGSTVDVTRHRELTVAVGQRHNGTAGTGAVVDGQTTTAFPIKVGESDTRVEWLEIKNGYDTADGVSSSLHVGDGANTVTNVMLEYMLVYDYDNAGQNNAGARSNTGGGINSFTIRNSIFYNGNFAVRSQQSIDTVTVENCTSYDMSRTGFEITNSAIMSATNTIATSSNNDFSVSVTGNYNLSSDGTAPGANSLLNKSASVQFVSIAAGSEDLHLKAGADALDTADPTPLSFCCDIDGAARIAPWDIGADDFLATTAVELVSFEALAADSAVDLEWRTGSELDNLGFHIYRSPFEDGPWTRITPSLIPGLGSSPEGASYSFRETGLVNGTKYFYKLEDIDTSSVSTFHGPVSATPSASATAEEGDEEPAESGLDDDSESSGDQTAYGSPGEPSFRIVSRNRRSIVVELTTPGFVAEETPTGVRVSVPGFDSRRNRRAPALPLKRALLDGVVGRHARVVWAKEKRVLSFPGLTPAAVGGAEILVRRDGTVRPRRRGRSLKKTRARNGVLPRSAVRIAGDAFIGEAKKLALEMSPIRYDTRSRRLLLARTLRVKLSFDRKARTKETGRGSRGRRRPRSARRAQRESGVLVHLHTLRTGLHAVSFEALSLSGPVPLDALRLSLLGEPVAFHVKPRSSDFGPGSVLFFHAASVPSSMDFSSETTYALERASGGVRMARLSSRSKGLAKVSSAPLAEKRFETNRFYQPGLLDAPDIWLWDFMVGGMSKSVPFSIQGLDSTSSQPAQIQVVFQGASQADVPGEHHLSVSLNGTPLGETSFDGKLPHVFSTSFSASLLLEGENSLTLTNLGDTGAYSFVFLDRVDLVHPQTLALRQGRFGGLFSEGGKALVSGTASYGVDVTDPVAPRWLRSLKSRKGRVRFKAEAGHRYLLASSKGLLSPRVSKPVTIKTKLRSPKNQADYVVIAPEAFLVAAQPLLQRRQDQGLSTKAVSFEQITSEFGYGRPSAEGIRDFLIYAFHNWTAPSVKYVLLLGDASSDPRNFTGRDKGAPLPAFWAKTSYLWTSSDPTLGAVNGEDGLPDLAIGRFPATTLEEAHALVQKVLAWEDSAQDLSGKAILVADNPDIAGDFEADIADIRASFLGGRETQSLLLRQLGANTRPEILAALDGGASILSYVGHGGPAVWASENVLNSWDPPKLLAQSQQPLMMTFNCLNGYFVAPNYDSLAEAFMKVEGRGTIGAFSPSGLSLDGPAHRFHRALMAEIVSGEHERLGDAVLAAQAAYAETGLMPELLAVYHLFADPAMRIIR